MSCPRWRMLWLACVLGAGTPACGTATTPTTAVPVREPVPLGRLPEGVRPTAYELELRIVPGEARFTGRVRIALELDRPATGIWMHGQDLDVTRVSARQGNAHIEGTWQQRTTDGVSRVELTETLAAGSSWLEIEYTGGFDHPLRGLYEVESKGRRYAFTQFESISARLAFPCFDEPRFKTPFAVTLIVPADQHVAANTPIRGVDETGTALKRVEFEPTPPLPTYLIAWAVGPLDIVPGEPIPGSELRPRAIPFRGIAARGQGDRLGYALDHTAAYVEALEDYFAIPYPYRKLDVVAVPDFGAGAMENVGLITFREWLLLVDPRRSTEGQRRAFAYVMAHELAHQWFGNLVTMPWWNDIWLNEAFATWMGNKVVGALHPEYRVELASLASTQQTMKLDSLTSARRIRQPVRDNNDIQNAFDAITYRKGGAVLDMFERWMGADRFRDGIRRYLDAHREGTATAEDLLVALDAVDDRDVSTPFMTFLNQAGVPLIEANLECTEQGAVLELSQQRYLPLGSKGDPNQSWQIPMCIRASTGRTCALLQDPIGRVELPGCPTWWMPNDDAAGYFRFALSSDDWSSLRRRGFDELSARGQMAASDSLFAEFRRGTLDARDVLPWLPALSASPVRTIATSPMRWLRFLIEDVAPPEARHRIRGRAADLYRKRYRALGWRARKGESSDRSLLREAVIRFMVMDVRDPEARRRAAALGSAIVGYRTALRPRAVEPQLAAVVLAAAVQERGVGLFDQLVGSLRSSSNATERNRVLAALGHAEEPELATRARDLALSDLTRVNEMGQLLRPQFANPETRDDAWVWFQANFDAVRARIGTQHLARTIWYAASFCTEGAAAEVEGFFEPKVADMVGGQRMLAGALEQITLCAVLARAQQAATAEAFSR